MLSRLLLFLGGATIFMLVAAACSSLSLSDATSAPSSEDDQDGTDASGATTDDGPGTIPIPLDGFASLPSIDWTTIQPVRISEAQQGATLSVLDYGAVANDGQPDDDAFQSALESADTNGIINAPAGEFNFARPVRIPSRVVLRGEGSSTILAFDLNGAESDLVSIKGQPASDWVDLAQVASAGDLTLVPAGNLGIEIAAGDIVEVEQANTEAMYTLPEWDVPWAEGSEGELAEVVSYDGTTIEIDHPLFSTYELNRSAKVRVIDPARFSGIEDLKIIRNNTGYGSSIRLSYAADVWVKGVESELTTKAHVEADVVYRCQIEDNVIHDAHDFGDGGRAYGISVQRHTTGCRVQNNTLYDNRHAMIIQLGASGNVFAYNHARGSAGYADRQPRADISLHGHWPQANLFEGNVVDRVVFADWWGPSGPANTLHRNCVLDSVIVADSSNDQFLIGNIVGDAGLTIEEGISGTTEIANRIQGTPVAEAASPPSLFLSEQPAYLADSAWPVVAPESGTGSDREAACRIPAGERSPLGYD